MTLSRAIILFFLAIPLTSCQRTQPVYYAYKHGTTLGQKITDTVACRVHAIKQVPANTQLRTTPIYRTPTDVYGGQTYSYDANSSLRNNVELLCMVQKGYTFTRAEICSQRPIEILKPKAGDFLQRLQMHGCVVSLGNRIYVPVNEI